MINNPNLWSWLTLFWFDQLCPIEKNGKRNVKEIVKYICSSDFQKYYRHIVAGSYEIYYLHRDEYARLFLYSPLFIHNDFMEQTASRQGIITNKGFIQMIDKLYWDINLKKPKIGASSPKKMGNLRRLISIVNQMELTYDLRSMSKKEILSLIPSEFDMWK